MKIENKRYGRFILTPEKETLEDIAVAVIMASYDLAVAYGLGFSRPHNTPMTREMAKQMLGGKDISGDYISNRNKVNDVDMDYVFGRCCKTLVKVFENYVDIMISERDRNPQAILEKVKILLKKE